MGTPRRREFMDRSLNTWVTSDSTRLQHHYNTRAKRITTTNDDNHLIRQPQ